MQLIMPYLAFLFLKQKLSAMHQQITAAFALLGGQGDMPSASQFLQVSHWKKPVEMVTMS